MATSNSPGRSEPPGSDVSPVTDPTHCSAFVASFSKQLGVYMLRPPDHSPTLLANAQMRWLSCEAGVYRLAYMLDAP